MKMVLSVLTLGVTLISGCAGESTASSTNSDSIDCAIEVQIAVVSGLKSGQRAADGNWSVAASCVLPVQSTGGAGVVVSNTDGTIVRIRWQDVRRGWNGLQFDGFEWSIENRIDRRDGTSMTLNGQQVNTSMQFGPEFEWLADCEIDTGGLPRTGRRLVTRGRLLPVPPAASPLHLEEMAGL